MLPPQKSRSDLPGEPLNSLTWSTGTILLVRLAEKGGVDHVVLYKPVGDVLYPLHVWPLPTGKLEPTQLREIGTVAWSACIEGILRLKGDQLSFWDEVVSD